jgi:hypothetical protein
LGTTITHTPTGHISRQPRQPSAGSAAAVKYVTNDHIRVDNIEDRLKQWHSNMGDNPRTQIRSLTRYVSEIK